MAKLPLYEPYLTEYERASLIRCFESGWISSASPQVREFEDSFKRRFSEKPETDVAVAVSNGTVALELALLALGLGDGDYVGVPDLTFAATINAVINVGAIPVIFDIDSESWNLDCELLREEKYPKLSAIIFVHLYGNTNGIKRLARFCSDEEILLVEDCAEGLGSLEGGVYAGNFGCVSTFSFYANKTITTGEGGMVLFRDSKIAERARKIRDHGIKDSTSYFHDYVGRNMRLTGLQASIGVSQIIRFDEISNLKSAISGAYKIEFAKYQNPRFHDISKGNIFWLKCVTFESELDRERAEKEL